MKEEPCISRIGYVTKMEVTAGFRGQVFSIAIRFMRPGAISLNLGAHRPNCADHTKSSRGSIDKPLWRQARWASSIARFIAFRASSSLPAPRKATSPGDDDALFAVVAPIVSLVLVAQRM